jgi:hypothetical protein
MRLLKWGIAIWAIVMLFKWGGGCLEGCGKHIVTQPFDDVSVAMVDDLLGAATPPVTWSLIKPKLDVHLRTLGKTPVPSDQAVSHAADPKSRGMKSYDSKDYAAAEPALREAIEANPFDVTVSMRLAQVLGEKGMAMQGEEKSGILAEAKRLGARSLGLNPQNPQQWIDFGEVYSSSGEWEKLAACFNLAYFFSAEKDKAGLYAAIKGFSTNQKFPPQLRAIFAASVKAISLNRGETQPKSPKLRKPSPVSPKDGIPSGATSLRGNEAIPGVSGPTPAETGDSSAEGVSSLPSLPTIPGRTPIPFIDPKLKAPRWLLSPAITGENIAGTWEPVPEAVRYFVYLNGVKVLETFETLFRIPFGSLRGTQTFEIRAVNSTGEVGQKSLPGVLEVPGSKEGEGVHTMAPGQDDCRT